MNIANAKDIYVGTYTKPHASQGIYRIPFIEATQSFGEAELCIPTTNPSFIVWNPHVEVLYAVHEVATFHGEKSGGVSAWKHNQDNTWTACGEFKTGGPAACHLAVNGAGNLLVVANYNGDNVAGFTLAKDGSIMERSFLLEHQGTGPNVKRQSKPHPHGIYFISDNAFYVCDLGTDGLWPYQVQNDASVKALPMIKTEAGAGPRHMVFTSNLAQAYVVNELDNTVSAWNRSGNVQVSLSPAQIISTLPADFQGNSSTAEILLSPTEKWLLASNRGHESIAVFQHNKATGELTAHGYVIVEGLHPRSFTLSEDGQWLVVANKDSANITFFKWDEATANAKYVASKKLKDPVCVLFAR